MLAVAGTGPLTATDLSVGAYHSYLNRNQLWRTAVAAGESLGNAAIQNLGFGSVSDNNTVFYGDLSLKAMAAPANNLPVITGVSATTTDTLPVTVTLSVAASDPDGTISHIEWFCQGYNYGRAAPTLAGTASNVAVVFPVSGVYTVRVEVVDQYKARTWREFQVAVTNGMPITWMQDQGLTLDGSYPTWEDVALGDQDHDGMPTWAEYLAGTEPTNSLSCLKFGPFGRAAGALILNLDTVAGFRYDIYQSTNLTDVAGWQIFTNFTGTGGKVELPVADTLPIRYYHGRVHRP
ncbi:MAG: hypothetical protein WCG36_09720 [bacterium]